MDHVDPENIHIYQVSLIIIVILQQEFMNLKIHFADFSQNKSCRWTCVVGPKSEKKRGHRGQLESIEVGFVFSKSFSCQTLRLRWPTMMSYAAMGKPP